MGMRGGELVEVLLFDLPGGIVDDIANLGGLLDGFDEHDEQLRVEKDSFGVRLHHGMLQPVGAERVVRGDDGHRL